MQQRIQDIRQRKELLVRIKELQKSLTILLIQVENLEKKPLGQTYQDKKSKLRSLSDQLKQLRSHYLKLATAEMETLKSHLRNTISQIRAAEECDVDLEDRRFSLQHTIWALQQEMDEVKRT